MKDLESNKKNLIELNDLDSTNTISKIKYLEQSNDIKLSLIEKGDKRDHLKIKAESKNTLYGNNIIIKNPKKIGKMRVLFYCNNYPLIVIGPECKYYILILNFLNF